MKIEYSFVIKQCQQILLNRSQYWYEFTQVTNFVTFWTETASMKLTMQLTNIAFYIINQHFKKIYYFICSLVCTFTIRKLTWLYQKHRLISSLRELINLFYLGNGNNPQKLLVAVFNIAM